MKSRINHKPAQKLDMRELALTEQQADLILQHHNAVLFAQQKLDAAVSMVLAAHGVKPPVELVKMTKQALTVRVLEG